MSRKRKRTFAEKEKFTKVRQEWETQPLAPVRPEWLPILQPVLEHINYKRLLTFLTEWEVDDEKVLYPPKHLVYRCLSFCPPAEIKAVILGQDPYLERGQADGLSFSVPPRIDLPPSLKNIFQAVRLNYPKDFPCCPENGSLEGWAKQGVLLLNATLTVMEKQPNSCENYGWQYVTGAILSHLKRQFRPMVFFAWGRSAEKLIDSLSIDELRHKVLRSVHPSSKNESKQFLANKHFKECNDYLVQNGVAPIDWTQTHSFVPKSTEVVPKIKPA